jgi:hypothetical protein
VGARGQRRFDARDHHARARGEKRVRRELCALAPPLNPSKCSLPAVKFGSARVSGALPTGCSGSRGDTLIQMATHPG